MTYATREEWLNACIAIMRESLFKPAGYELPDTARVSVGWTNKRKAIGECWSSTASKAGYREIFISPALDDALEVAAVLAHECGHATLPDKVGHRKPFAKLVDAIGLIGKPTATMAGPGFMKWFRDSCEDQLGAYPHKGMMRGMGLKKQTTRLIKIACPACADMGEPYILRASATTIERGLPICPIHNEHLTT